MQATHETPFGVGDSVLHPARPEWGPGRVLDTATDHGSNGPAQRLTVRFAQAGVRTISTAYVALQRADARLTTDPDTPAGNPQALETLPEAATDPLRPLADRLAATLGLYRYTNDGPGLIAWASTMTGQADPLATRTRQDLEEAFTAWARLRERHLRSLVPLASREVSAAALAPIVAGAPPGAREALRRIHRSR